MTTNEMQELEALDMDETALAERQAQVSAMLARNEIDADRQQQVEQAFANGRKRRTRSDAGLKKGPRMVKEPSAPPPANVGLISPQQAAQLIRLAELMRGAAQKLAEAERLSAWAAAEYAQYVESLTQSE